ncbi:MAG: hypothetical protein ACPIOQ_11590, partial [Promethearchaeia archaeon]
SDLRKVERKGLAPGAPFCVPNAPQSWCARATRCAPNLGCMRARGRSEGTCGPGRCLQRGTFESGVGAGVGARECVGGGLCDCHTTMGV